MANNIGYIVTPMGLTERQMLIYQKLYERCNFTDMTVKYTIEQLSCDIKITDIPIKTIYKNIQIMIKKGYLEVIKKASKGNAPIYRIISYNKLLEKTGEPKVSQERTKGEPKHSKNKGLNTISENQGRNGGEPKVSPIKEKEKEYINIYSHWNRKEIIVHKSLSKDMERSIEKSLKKYLESSYYFNYKWSLTDFLNRKNGIDTFTEEGSNKANYESWKREEKHNANTNRFTKRDRGVFNKDSENIRIELPEREFKHYTNEELAALGID